MKDLAQMWVCASGHWCQGCRDLEGGRPGRLQLMSQGACHIPDDTVDWQCPRGHPWGFTPPGTKLIVGPVEFEGTLKNAGCSQCGLSIAERRRMSELKAQPPAESGAEH